MIHFITSLNSELYKIYGKKFFESYERFAGDDIKLTVVFEGEMPEQFSKKFKKIQFIKFDNTAHSQFISYFGHLQEAHGLRIQQNDANQFNLHWDYKFNAIRFSFKIFAIDIARQLIDKNSFFVWIDADIKCLKKFSSYDLNQFMPEKDSLMSYLGRSHFPPNNPYSECGFLGFNSNHPQVDNFINRMVSIYKTGEIFSKKEWHDSWIWDEVRKEFETQGVHFKNISGKAAHLEHPFINCGLGEYFDHLKGPERKKMGKSLDSDYQN